MDVNDTTIMYINIKIHVYACMFVCTYINIYIHKYIYKYIHTLLDPPLGPLGKNKKIFRSGKGKLYRSLILTSRYKRDREKSRIIGGRD
jgi:hypothetical protein